MDEFIVSDHDPGVTRKSVLRQRIEELRPGQWLDTGKVPSRDTTRKICGLTAAARHETGNRYTVRADADRGTTWVHCLEERE